MTQAPANVTSREGEPLSLKAEPAAALGVLWDVGELVKARLSCLVLITVAVGYQLGRDSLFFDYTLFLATLLGALLGAFGANALNQWREIGFDRQMERTRSRPLAAGRWRPEVGLAFALGLLLLGTALLAWCHPVAALVNVSIALGYMLVYTPMKRRTAWSLLPGAIVGAAPPLIGWVAARGQLDAGAWALFGIIFAWQLPHFLAIDWMHREDYGRAGYRMVSRADPSGALSGWLSVLFSVGLIAVSLTPLLTGQGGVVYLTVAVVLGAAMLYLSVALLRARSTPSARRLFFGSLAYLPILLAVLVLVRT